MNSAAPKTSQIGHELGIIRSSFGKEISALKGLNRHRHSVSSSSYASSASLVPGPSESITSATQWNEKIAEISLDDKFSTIIDDGKKSSTARRRLMMEQEINSGSGRDYGASSDANESIGALTMPPEGRRIV